MGKAIKQPTNTEIAWFAGFFDGEGYIGIARQKPNKTGFGIYHVIIEVTNTHIPTIQRIKELWGIGNIYIYAKYKGNKPLAFWHITGNNAVTILRMCLPYLSAKRDEAEIAIAFQEIRNKRISPFSYIGRVQYADALSEKEGEKFKRLLYVSRN